MARILILCDRFPEDMTSGHDLRVGHMCEELSREHCCFFVDLADDPQPVQRIKKLGLADACSLPKPPEKGLAKLRHFRLTDAHYLQRCSKSYFNKALQGVENLATKWGIELSMSFAPHLAEIAIASGLPRILDYPDCESLAMRRELTSRGREMSRKDTLKAKLRIARQTGRERYLLQNYDRTITIAEPDKHGFLRSAQVAQDRVSILPNGVDPAALDVHSRPPQKGTRSLVFWGNFDFPPNWTAVTYFYHEVFLPYLADSDVTLWLVGRGGGEAIDRIGKHPNVRIAGYKENLFSFIADKSVMINPMVEGGGLKNKVLESFACMIPVVSTSLGVEALPVKDRQECFIADDPGTFAGIVLDILNNPVLAESVTRPARSLIEQQFTWEIVGNKLREIVNSHLTSEQRRVDR